MSKMWNRCKVSMATRLLTWLGIGSSALLFMACYGPAPTNYRAEPYPIDLEEVDSTEVVEEADSVAVAGEQQ